MRCEAMRCDAMRFGVRFKTFPKDVTSNAVNSASAAADNDDGDDAVFPLLYYKYFFFFVFLFYTLYAFDIEKQGITALRKYFAKPQESSFYIKAVKVKIYGI